MKAIIVRRILPITPIVVILAAILAAYVGTAGSTESAAAPQPLSYMSIPF